MSEDNKQLLEKAHSLAHHLGRVAKAVSSFHDHMTKLHKAHHDAMHKAHSDMMKAHTEHMTKVHGLHKAHHDDMHKAIQHLHKMVGVEPGEDAKYGIDEPKSMSLMDAGTKNLQDFGGTPSPDAAKAANGSMTKAEVAEMLNEGFNSFATTFLKALSGDGDGDGDGDGEECPSCGKPMKHCKCKAKKAAGIGDRSQSQQPIFRATSPTVLAPAKGSPEDVSNGLTKATPTAQMTPDLARAALNGDRDALRKFMQSSQDAQNVPDTILEPLSKIH